MDVRGIDLIIEFLMIFFTFLFFVKTGSSANNLVFAESKPPEHPFVHRHLHYSALSPHA